MALAWKAGWVQALRGSNPLSSAQNKLLHLAWSNFFDRALGIWEELGFAQRSLTRDGSPILRHTNQIAHAI